MTDNLLDWVEMKLDLRYPCLLFDEVAFLIFGANHPHHIVDRSRIPKKINFKRQNALIQLAC